MELHVDANMIGQAPSEEFGLLVRGEAAGVRHPCLEGILVRRDGGGERQAGQVRKMVQRGGPNRW